MTTYYRNRETGIVSAHPTPGIGESLNADEIGEDGKAVKPYTSLAPTPEELKAARDLLKDKSASPLDVTAAEEFLAKHGDHKTSGKSAGDSKEGDQ